MGLLDYINFETDMSGITDTRVRMVLTDPISHLPLFYKGFSLREVKLIKKAMLLQVGCKAVVNFDVSLVDDGDMDEELLKELREPVPDLVKRYQLRTLPDFDAMKLAKHIRDFTEMSIDLLKIEDETAGFVKKNQEGVIDYLVEKLEAGKLKFYGDHPDRHDCSLAIGNFTDPEKPNLLYLVYGMRALLYVPPVPTKRSYLVYVPWKPYLKSSEEAY